MYGRVRNGVSITVPIAAGERLGLVDKRPSGFGRTLQ